jgi:hypothetical protein
MILRRSSSLKQMNRVQKPDSAVVTTLSKSKSRVDLICSVHKKYKEDMVKAIRKTDELLSQRPSEELESDKRDFQKRLDEINNILRDYSCV